MKFVFSIIAISSLALPTSAYAWNERGHLVVAAVAWDQLSQQARDEVSRLLKLNPDYNKWLEGMDRRQKDKIAFMRSAVWPDVIKRDDDYTDDGSQPNGPNASRNAGYSDFFMHRYWHYRDEPFSPDGTALEHPPEPNAVERIELFARAIGSNDISDSTKSYDISWLAHLVGDIHQPLHATSRFTQTMRHGDNGGNSVKICLPRSRLCNSQHSYRLHGFWDGAVGTSKSIGGAMSFAVRLPKAPKQDVAIIEPKKWASESFRIAKRVSYSDPIGEGKGPYRLDRSYRVVAGSVAERRIAIAGARLASLLNAAFDTE